MQKKYVGFLGSVGKKLLRGSVHVGMAGIAIFNFSNVAEAKSDQYYVNLFFKSGYGYCDARKLAKAYGSSVWQAKIRSGKKLSYGWKKGLDSFWQQGSRIFWNNGNTCSQSSLTPEEQKFAYNDASRVVDAWVKGNKS